MTRKKKRILRICTILIVLLIILPFCASIYIYERIFSERCMPDPLYVRSITEFDGLQADRYRFSSDNNQQLAGYCYYYEQVAPRGVVILAHGLGGGGQIPYLSLSNYFAAHGYLVFAFDATGNGESEGEDPNGFPQGTIDLDYAIDFVQKTDRFAGLPIVLFGHSWGGYSSGCVLNRHPEIRAVVSAAGPDDSIELIASFGEKYAGSVAAVLVPYLTAYEYLKFGSYATYSCCEGFENSDCGVMLLHSRDDTVVTDSVSCEVYREEFRQDDRFVFVEYESRGHSGLFYCEDATAYRERFSHELASQPDKEKAAYVSAHFDEARAYALDEALMEKILTFYDTYTVP